MLTQDELNSVQHLEQNFFSALNLNYKRSTPKVDNLLVHSLYEKELGHPYKTNINCPKCLLTLYKAFAQIYYSSKDALTKAASEVVEVVEELIQEPQNESEEKEVATQLAGATETTKKKATPKKSKTNKK